MESKKALSYDDVLLAPQYSEIKSRGDINISTSLGGPYAEIRLGLPILASPMDTISEGAMGITMWQEGGLAVIHRYNSIEDQAAQIDQVVVGARGHAAGAIGASGDYLERATALYDAGARILCVDVAHGHHLHVKNALYELRQVFGDAVHLMAGNVATLEGFMALAEWGANSIRVGIGGGSICSTRIQTGHGIPTWQSILAARTAKEILRADQKDVKIIADGGLRNSGDIVKALAAGADVVMVGSLLAGTTECPGEIIETKKGKFKTYRGMASKDAQIEWRGSTASLEGISTVVPYGGSVVPLLKELERGIRSGFSYSGALTLGNLHKKAQFIMQSNAARLEGTTHILTR